MWRKKKIKIQNKESAPQEIVFNESGDNHPEQIELFEDNPASDQKSLLKRYKTFVRGGVGLLLISILAWGIFVIINTDFTSAYDASNFRELREETVQLSSETALTDFFNEKTLDPSKTALLLDSCKKWGIIEFKAGQQLLMFFRKNSDFPECMFYEMDKAKSYFISFKRPEYSTELKKPVKTKFISEGWSLKVDMIRMITADSVDRPDWMIPWEVIQEIEPWLYWSISLRNIGKNDTLSIVWEIVHLESDPEEIISKNLVALRLKSRALSSEVLVFAGDHEGKEILFNEQGTGIRGKFLRSPVRYGRISSRYNLSRLHPVLKEIKPHRGTDFAAPEWTPILALADGEIIEAQFKQNNGNYVKIQHDSIYRTAYLHMVDFAPSITVGKKVKQGQVIGYVGETGLATGPHICLRFWRKEHQDDFVRSFPYLPKSERLQSETMQLLSEKRVQLERVLKNIQAYK